MLTPEQKAAAESPEREFVLLAAAGSGKTHTVAARVNHLIEMGYPPESILAITFTRKAAKELAERCDSGIWCGTIHSVCSDAIEMTGKSLRVIPDFEADMILRRCAMEVGICKDTRTGTKWAVSQDRCKEAVWSDMVNMELAPLRQAYRSKLDMLGAIDYEGLIVEAFSVGSDVWGKVRHLIVDEAQDTDGRQWNLIRHIIDNAGLGCTFMAVGDVRQSIYGWRWARPDMFLDSARVKMSLSTSFRNPEHICHAANRLIKNNPEGSPVSPHKPGGQILYGNSTVAEAIERAAEEMFTLSDIAVLCRSNRMVSQVEDELAELGIPCEVIKQSHFPGKIYWLLAYCADQHSPATQEGIWSSLCVPRQYCSQGIETVYLRLLSSPHQHEREAGAAIAASARKGVTVDEVLQHLESEIWQREKSYWVNNYEGRSIRSALNDWSLPTESEKETNSVSVCTIHQAKGLEFPCVIMPGMDEGKFPSRGSLKSVSSLEEERRVCYVGMTRAIDRLHLLFENEPSRFIREAMQCQKESNQSETYLPVSLED